MIPTARDRKKENFAKLRDYRTKSREYAWQLKKDGYIVDFFDRYRKCDRKKIIEIFERIYVYEFNGKEWTTIIDDITYRDFYRFYTLVQRYKHKYGKKKLHEHTSEILKELKL